MEAYASLRNLRFILHELLNFSKLQKYERFADYDTEAADMALDASRQIADTYLFPFYREMDKEKAYYEASRHLRPV